MNLDHIKDWLTKDQLEVGKFYAVHARNFTLAYWNGNEFIGVRNKFGCLFQDKEFHWDDGPPFGTVKPVRLFKV